MQIPRAWDAQHGYADCSRKLAKPVSLLLSERYGLFLLSSASGLVFILLVVFV